MTLTLKFDLFLKNFNLGYSFLTRRGRAFIFHMYIPYDKTFPSVPKFLTWWPWPWSLTYFQKTSTLAIDYLPGEVGLSYFTCAFFVARPSMRYHDFWPSDLNDLDLVGWPPLKKYCPRFLNQRGYLLLLFTYGCRRRAMLSSLTTLVFFWICETLNLSCWITLQSAHIHTSISGCRNSKVRD